MTNVVISEQDKKNSLQSAIYYLSESQPFYGSLLQEFTVKYTDSVPTAGITYNAEHQQYEIYINPFYFTKCLNNELRISCFHHEMLHFTNKHLFRLPFLEKATSPQERMLFNVAGDMAINQFLNPIAKGCELCKNIEMKSGEDWEKAHPTEEIKRGCPGKWVDVKNWKLDDGQPFPTFQNMETYYELIKKESKKQQKSEDNKQKGKGQGTKGNVNDMLGGFKQFDVHDFFEGLDEETKQKMLDEAKKIIKRTIEKTSFSHSNVPDSIKDLLQEIETLSSSLNYKQILKSVIKKTVSCSDREGTWKKPNKRYGAYSRGTKVGVMPNLTMLVDTSGSISTKELNEFLAIMSNFLKVGTRQCWLGLWHTSLYYKKKYKLNGEIDKSEVQSGGTCVASALEDVRKTKPNLAIFFTDGYYSAVDVPVNSEVVWIISKGGNKEHPMKHLGKTIMLDGIC